MSFTSTRTISTLFQQILAVTRSVQTDLFAIQEMYHPFTDDFVKKLVADLRVMMDEDTISRIVVNWVAPGTSRVVDALRYIVEFGEAKRPNDRPGGLAYEPALKNAIVKIRIHDSNHWKQLPKATKLKIAKMLLLPWSRGGTLDYSGGKFVSDRGYGQSQVGISRERFIKH
jgi:hypothetical protein